MKVPYIFTETVRDKTTVDGNDAVKERTKHNFAKLAMIKEGPVSRVL